MQDTFTVIIALFLGAILIFVVPLVTYADRNDTIAQEDIQTIVDEFVNDVRSTGKITIEEFENFENKIIATGDIVYDIQIEIQALDENPAKKTSQTSHTKIGENVYVVYYTTQIDEILKELGVFELKEGDIIIVKVANTNITLYENLKKTFLGTTNEGTSTIAAHSSAMITINGTTTEVIQQEKYYSIIYNKNTADNISGMPTNEGKMIGQDYRISTTVPTREGFSFMGWSESSSALEKQFTPGEIYKENRSLTLYAVWKKEAPKILMTTTSVNVDNSMLDKIKAKLTTTHPNAIIDCVTKEEGERYISDIVYNNIDYYDLVIINNRVWNLPAGLINDLSKKTNVLTISNDADRSLNIIATEQTISSAYMYYEMTTAGKNKIGVEVPRQTDSSLRKVKLVDGVEMLYTARYVSQNGSYETVTSDAIGAMKVQGTDGKEKTWVHSQISLDQNHGEIISKLVAYALGEIGNETEISKTHYKSPSQFLM